MFILTGFGDEISPDINEQIKILKEEKIKYLEIRGANDRNVLDLADEEIKDIKSTLDKSNIRISAISSPIGKTDIKDDFAKSLKSLERAIYLAKFFKTKYIRIFSYFMPEGEDPQKYRDEVIRRMKIKAELAEKEKIILLHENESLIYGNTAEKCKDILDTVNSKYLRLTFDPANFVVEGEKPYPDCFEKLVDYILYLHMKDAKFGEGVNIVPAGEGDGKIKEILQKLGKKNFEGFISLEPHLVFGGQYGGFSGPELFKKASKALKKILKEINAEWR